MNKPQDYVFALHRQAFKELIEPDSRFVQMPWESALKLLDANTAIVRQDLLSSTPDFFEIVPCVLVRRDRKDEAPQFLAYQDPEQWSDMHRLLFEMDMNHKHAEMPSHEVVRDNLHLTRCLQQSVIEGVKKAFGDQTDYLYEESITDAFRGFLIDPDLNNANIKRAFETSGIGMVFEFNESMLTWSSSKFKSVEPPYKWLGFDTMSNHNRFGHDWWSEAVKNFALEQKVDDVQASARHDERPTFQIWREGFAATGQSETALFLGLMHASSFEEAVQKYVASHPNKTIFDLTDPKRMTCWGCRLFDNEVDARRSFG